MTILIIKDKEYLHQILEAIIDVKDIILLAHNAEAPEKILNIHNANPLKPHVKETYPRVILI